MKITVTFPEIVETFDLGDDFSMEEFLKDPEMALDVYISDVHHEYDWELEDKNA